MPESISINQVEYSINTDGYPTIHVFGRDKDGVSRRLDVTGFAPYFYALKPLPQIPKSLLVDPNEYTSIKGEPCKRVYVQNPSDEIGRAHV